MNSQIHSLRKRLRLAAPVIWCALLLGAAATAEAVQYRVNGQVLQIPTEMAADETKTDDQLTGPAVPFVRIKVYDRDDGTLLGEADAGQTGGYTVRFDLGPADPAPRIECRVYLVVDGGSTLLPAAREAINDFPKTGGGGIATFQFALLKVGGDDIIDYDTGGPGSLYGEHADTPGIGLVFTRVGKVEISEIKGQDLSLSPALTGLVDYTGTEARAGQLGVHPFKHAPFARRLMIFGDFGLPSGGACPLTGAQVDWYQIKIKKVQEPVPPAGFPSPLVYESEIPWQDPMDKRRTQLVVSSGPPPSVHATVTTEKIGPFTGYLDDPATPWVDRGPTTVGSLYRVNRNQAGGTTNVFYSYPDLRVNWVSGAADGLYELSPVYYRIKPNFGGDEKIVEEIPYATCFNTGTITGDADKVALHKLYIRVNNDPLTTSFDHIYLVESGSSPKAYFPATGTTPTTNVNNALDFANEGLCEIMEAGTTYDIEVHFTAHHTGDYMRYYKLYADPNAGPTVTFADVSYPPTSPYPAAPDWEGTPAGGTSATALNGEFVRCGYDFQLSAGSRLQNGYQHVQWSHPDLAFFVNKPIP